MPVRGFVEKITNSQVRGWAYQVEAPHEHLAIEVAVESNVIATTTARLFRDDLQQGHVGDGDHAFVANFPCILGEHDLQSLSVVALSLDLTPVCLKHIATVPEARTSPVAPVIDYPSSFDADHQESPIFILGAARSGTSAMAQSLVKSGHCEGCEEGHFLELAGRMMEVAHRHYEDNGEELGRQTLIRRVPLHFMGDGIKDIFRTATRLAFPSGRWLDKSPKSQMALSAPLFQEIWPQAKFVFMKRRAIENVASRLRKFPNVSFARHCQDWTDMMVAWRHTRDALGSSGLEIEQLCVALDPASVVQKIAEFLDMPPAATRRFAEILAAERPERTAPIFAATLDLDDVRWSDSQKEQFNQICMNEMQAFGYSLDRSYYSTRPSPE
jgi:hypothetical protein